MKIPEYRAWHIENKQYYEVLAIDFFRKQLYCLHPENYSIFKAIPSQITFSFKEVILEPATGHKDKNNDSIYVGDIVKLDEWTYEKYWDNEVGNYICNDIFYGQLYGVVKNTTHNGFIVKVTKAYDGVNEEVKQVKITRKLKRKNQRLVIGNIHENEDLL